MRLRDLDARLVPRLAAWLRAGLDGSAGRRNLLGAVVQSRWQALLHPLPPGRLRRLDDRYASCGPLSLVRDVPQLGLLIVAAVFLAGAGVALTLNELEARGERTQGQGADAARPFTLGPAVGSSIQDHFAQVRERAVRVAEDDPDDRFLALVSLSEGITAVAAQQLADQNGLTVRRVYLRAPVSGELPEILPVQTPGDLLAALTAVYEQTASRKAEEQREFVSLADSIEPTSEEEAQFKKFYEAAARTAGQEAAAYGTSCSCVFALVVEGQARRLVDLTALPAVRGVELAARGAELTALDIQPLPPDATGVVEAPTRMTGGS